MGLGVSGLEKSYDLQPVCGSGSVLGKFGFMLDISQNLRGYVMRTAAMKSPDLRAVHGLLDNIFDVCSFNRPYKL